MKIIVGLGVISALLFFYLRSNAEKEQNNLLEVSETYNPDETIQVDDRGFSRLSAVIKTVHGNISFKFFPKKAPNTVKRIMTLINDGFYDGLIFHKVVPGFVLQTGDPTNTGKGGSGQSLKAELNDIEHVKGTIGMARSKSLDSASSQFYISLERHPHLDRKYTVFAQVVSGIEVLDKIVVGDRILSLTIQDQAL